MRRLLYLWAFPNTAIGLLIAIMSIFSGGTCNVVDGVLEVAGGFAAVFLRRLVPLKGGASAMTLGHVVIGRDRELLDLTRIHERVHVRQAQRWGPIFIPLYLSFSLILLLRGRDPYRSNPFEREAYEKAG